MFAPAGSKAGAQSGRDLLIDLPERSRVVSAAALPGTEAATLERFARHAFAFVEATTVNWQFDEASGRLLTRYVARTRAAAGGETTPLVSLYPHQTKFVTQPVPDVGRFDAIRGPMPILASGSFETAMQWRGFLPHWPMLGGDRKSTRLNSSH